MDWQRKRIRTEQDYMESLRGRKMEIYFMGERVVEQVDHPAFRPHINAAALTYAQQPHDLQYKELMTARSHLTGDTINRFTHIHQSTDDLVRKVKMLRALGQRTGSCFQRCVGLDALNALYIVTFEMDRQLGTQYHGRLFDFVEC